MNIARALALEPRLVILDEAVAALDKSVEAQVLNLLAELKEKFNLTYLFISHDLNVVEYMSDRVMVMYLGRVVETGPVEAIYSPSAASLYARVVRLEADAGSGPAHDRNAADRRSAESDQSALRLPLPHALRVRRGGLRRTVPPLAAPLDGVRRHRHASSSPAILPEAQAARRCMHA